MAETLSPHGLLAMRGYGTADCRVDCFGGDAGEGIDGIERLDVNISTP
jgi:hypothetical protein